MQLMAGASLEGHGVHTFLALGDVSLGWPIADAMLAPRSSQVVRPLFNTENAETVHREAHREKRKRREEK
jgi:hypothetical protein